MRPKRVGSGRVGSDGLGVQLDIATAHTYDELKARGQ